MHLKFTKLIPRKKNQNNYFKVHEKKKYFNNLKQGDYKDINRCFTCIEIELKQIYKKYLFKFAF